MARIRECRRCGRVMSGAASALALAGLALVAAAGCHRAAPVAEETSPPAAVKWEAPLRGALEDWTELVGTTVPLVDRLARVSAPIEGRVVALLEDRAAEGQRVEKGTVLVRLDDTVVRANLAKAAAAQEVLGEELKQARYAVELASSEVERLRKLKAEEDARPGNRASLVSPVDRLKADYALKDAQSRLKAAEGRLAVGLQEQQALQAQLRLHTIAAPIGGRLGRITVALGQTLAAGAPVAEIVDLSEHIDVLCFVPASVVARLRPGQPALTGGFDAGAAQPAAEGQVEYIAEQAEAETGSFAVKLRFPNRDAALRANRVVRVRVLTGPGRECLSIPLAALQEDEEPPTVVIVLDVKTVRNAEGHEETVGVARRVHAVLGVRDRLLRQVEIVRLEDPEKDPARRWHGAVKDALFVVEGGQGLQSGDAVKLDVEAD